jgi:uncharacterized protein YjbJ (UPF0337 family)
MHATALPNEDCGSRFGPELAPLWPLVEEGPSTREKAMDDRNLREQGAENNLKGTGNDLKGRVKDAAGGLTGNSSMQAEGKWDQATGKVQDAIGDVQQQLGRETNGTDRI